MTVIALSSFVVVPDYALAVRDECETILVSVSRALERRGDYQNNDFGEQVFAMSDAVADDKSGLQDAQYGLRA